jgi:hypothetical protein
MKNSELGIVLLSRYTFADVLVDLLAEMCCDFSSSGVLASHLLYTD